jgi:hypothetical protein
MAMAATITAAAAAAAVLATTALMVTHGAVRMEDRCALCSLA